MAELLTLSRKSQLAAELDRAREGMSASWTRLRADADVPARVHSSFQRHKTAWLGGASVAGWLLARLPARKKKVFVDKHDKVVRREKAGGMLMAILGLAMPLLKPTITAFVTAKLSELAARKGKFEKRRT